MKTLQIKIQSGDRSWDAFLYNNATGKAIYEQLPLTIRLDDLFARELCYHFPKALPTDDVNFRGYKVGEIIYWPSRHSFVIMYAQNGERFDMQTLGEVTSPFSGLDGGDITVTLSAV